MDRWPLYHSDMFVQKNVGTDEQWEDLKNQILHLIRSNKKAEAGFLIERYKSRYGEINDK